MELTLLSVVGVDRFYNYRDEKERERDIDGIFASTLHKFWMKAHRDSGESKARSLTRSGYSNFRSLNIVIA